MATDPGLFEVLNNRPQEVLHDLLHLLSSLHHPWVMQTPDGCFHQQRFQSPLIAATLAIASRKRFYFDGIKIICFLIISKQPWGRQSLYRPGQGGNANCFGQCWDLTRELFSLLTTWFSPVTAAPQICLGHGCVCVWNKASGCCQIQWAQWDADCTEGQNISLN